MENAEDECENVGNDKTFMRPADAQLKYTILETLQPVAEKWSGVKLTGLVMMLMM